MRIGIVLMAILSITFWGFWNPIFGVPCMEWPSLTLEKDNVLDSDPPKVPDEEGQEVIQTLGPWQWIKGRSEITANAVPRGDTIEGTRYLAERTSSFTGKKERNP